MDGAGAQAVRDTFKHRGGTVCFMPPTLVYMLMGLQDTTRADFPHLKRLIYGGAPMPPEKFARSGISSAPCSAPPTDRPRPLRFSP